MSEDYKLYSSSWNIFLTSSCSFLFRSPEHSQNLFLRHLRCLHSAFLAVLDFILVVVEPDKKAQDVYYTEPALYFETASNKSFITIICSQITAYFLVPP
jgi:hypothetical protein